MCGLAGIFSVTENNAADVDLLQCMMQLQEHRGPDGHGSCSFPGLLLGHRRLSIIDLTEAASQPMLSADGKTAIAFNGEIYNFRDLRSELKNSGVVFKSSSDTEVVLEGFRKWGIDRVLDRLRGMFAFALYDQRESPVLYLARDRFGIKPLYFTQDRGTIQFASESKSLLPQMEAAAIDPDSLSLFLMFGSVPAPRTIWKDIFSVMPGEYLRINAEHGAFHSSRMQYWRIDQCDDRSDVSIKELLLNSVQHHLVSDVPVGVFLSGGLDSSAIAALAILNQPVRTINIRFEDAEFDEGEYAQRVAEHIGSQHFPVTVTESDFTGALPRILEAMDQPSVDGINTYFVSLAARNAGLKVMLSGLGADEVFLGYPFYRKLSSNQQAITSFLKQPRLLRQGAVRAAAAVQQLRGKGSWSRLDYIQAHADPLGLYAAIRGVFSVQEICSLTGRSEEDFSQLLEPIRQLNSGGNNSIVARLNDLDFNFYLANQLLRDSDVMSMCHSLELRVPFLDHKLVETVKGIPEHLKFHKTMNKPLLVDAVSSLLPDQVWRRKKMGFALPLAKWFCSSLTNIRERIESAGLFPAPAVARILSDFENGKSHWSRVQALLTASVASEHI